MELALNFCPYGEGKNPKSILQSLEQALQCGAESFQVNSGQQLRDFVHVDEVARQLVLLATHPHARGIFNGVSGSLFAFVSEPIILAMGAGALNRRTFDQYLAGSNRDCSIFRYF